MSYQVTIEPLGTTIEVENGQTMLDAALRAGIYLPHACCHGLCGTCKVQVVDGEFDHGPASPFALMARACLFACLTTSRYPLLAGSRYSPSSLSASLPAPGGSLGTGGDSATGRDGRRTTRTLVGNGEGLRFAISQGREGQQR